VVFGVLLVSVIHLRQLEAAKKLSERRYWSDEDEKNVVERARELTEEERLLRVRVYDASDIL
jgi:C4-dicarboxylate-specific signal transduction histidine kinase